MFGGISQLLKSLQRQPRICRMSDVLLLNCRVDDHLSQFFPGDVFVTDRKRDRFLKQRDKPVGTDSLAPLRQRRGVQRQLVLHRFEPAEVLPVRILHPAFQQ